MKKVRMETIATNAFSNPMNYWAKVYAFYYLHAYTQTIMVNMLMYLK